MADAGDAGNQIEDANPRAKLMEEVAAMMDAIEGDFGDDFEILNSIVIVMIKRPDGQNGLRIRSGLGPFEAVGFLSVAQDMLKAQAMGGGASAD